MTLPSSKPLLPIVLGSRSPQRRRLLELLIPPQRIVIDPPSSPVEEHFDSLPSRDDIEQRLREIARAKNRDVRARRSEPFAAVLTADTVIVGQDEACRLNVLGQPPAENWKEVVRDWFRRYYLGRRHWALTAVCITTPDGERREVLTETVVEMGSLAALGGEKVLDWYLNTGEPVGKAGGYGLQGAASLFVTAIQGSPSNVIGLPLRETRELLCEAGIDDVNSVRI